MILELKNYISVPQAAKMVNVHEETIRRLVRSGKIKAEKVGTQWFISQKDIDAFKSKRI